MVLSAGRFKASNVVEVTLREPDKAGEAVALESFREIGRIGPVINLQHLKVFVASDRRQL